MEPNELLLGFIALCVVMLAVVVVAAVGCLKADKYIEIIENLKDEETINL